MSERLRELERRHREAPDDLMTLRALADERRRRGEEMLPDVRRSHPWEEFWRACWTVAYGNFFARSREIYLPSHEGGDAAYGPGLANALYPIFARSRGALYPIFARSRGAYAMHLPISSITIS